jgi:hypothetical protein
MVAGAVFYKEVNMKITITMYDDFQYNFTCEHCYIDLRNHTFNIPGTLGIDSIGFERLKHIEIKNVEEMKNGKTKDNS